MSNWPPEFAPPKTLAGKLQRGLGSGFLEALSTPKEVVHPILMECIRVDPRLDHQIDDRTWYYGELVARTHLPTEAIASLLRDWGEEDEAGESWMALNVLVHLAKRGHEVADTALRDYVRWGMWWDDVVLEMGVAAAAEPWARIAPVVINRAETDESRWAKEPFISWAEFEPGAARLVEGAKRVAERFDEDRAKWPKLPTEELLNSVSQPPRRSARLVAPIVAERRSPHELQLVESALDANLPPVRGIAVLVRAMQGDFSRLDVAIDLIAGRPKPFFSSAIARDALLLAPADVLLPLARAWRASRGGRKVSTALAILKLHAERTDLDWVRARLRRTSPHADGDTHALCSLAEVISARFPGDSFPILARRFDAFTYSYGRGRLATALAVTDPSFPTTCAFTSLWDCESDVRVVAAEHVSLAVPGAVERLREMAADELEDERMPGVVAMRLSNREA